MALNPLNSLGGFSVGEDYITVIDDTGNVVAGNANIIGNLNVSTIQSANIVPSVDNTYVLGNVTNRWANIWLGPGTLFITDSANIANTASLTVDNGILLVNGTTGLQANLISGNSSLTVANSGNITLVSAGSANTLVVSPSGTEITGNLGVSGNIATTGNANVSGNLYVGDVGEDGSIIVDGTVYDSQLVVSAIGADVPAQFILHRHSTTQEPVIAGARSNTDDTTEAPVTNGMPLLSLYGAGWTGPDYQLFSAIELAADDSGTISGSTSTPGKITFLTSSDGSASNLNTALTIHNDQSAEFNGNVTVDQYLQSNFVITPATTVGALPSATTLPAGTRSFVSDATAPSFGVAVVGGGSVNVPVYTDGTTWLVG